MRAGLIGLPGSGKTSLFNAITRSNVPTHAYDAHETRSVVATVPVPDRRFDVAVRICNPKRRVPATLELVDGAARVEVHERGQKFGADFFAGIRQMEALVFVLRGFETPALGLPDGGLDAARDAASVEQELLLADLTVVEGRLERLAKARTSRRQTGGDAEEAIIRSLHAHLEDLRPLRRVELSPEEDQVARMFGLVSAKPLIAVLNVNEADLGKATPAMEAAASYAADNDVPLITLCAALEAEIAQMAPDEEAEFLAAMGVAESARDALVRVAYEYMGLISFLTVGADEVRAWTIRKGATAIQAAEKVHTDLARTFIRAEVMDFADFEREGGWDAARAAGKMRLEGKDYVVTDGQIVHIRNSRG